MSFVEPTVMIGDGAGYQEYAIGDVLPSGEKVNYATVKCWAIACDTGVCIYEIDDSTTLRIKFEPIEGDQPPVFVYLDEDEWEILLKAIEITMRRYKRDRAKDAENGGTR